MKNIDISFFGEDEYDRLNESGVIMCCDLHDPYEFISIDTLEGFDAQVSEYGLEIVTWNNGTAVEWMVVRRDDSRFVEVE